MESRVVIEGIQIAKEALEHAKRDLELAQVYNEPLWILSAKNSIAFWMESLKFWEGQHGLRKI